MNCLAELHQEPELKLTLKFEVEVLCKALNIDIQVISILYFNIMLNECFNISNNLYSRI